MFRYSVDSEFHLQGHTSGRGNTVDKSEAFDFRERGQLNNIKPELPQHYARTEPGDGL
jgi:hypothetical protein